MKNKIYWIGLICGIGIIFWNLRWTILYKFDANYWENFYYESQWNVANSKRIIPDEGVYRYIGYRLVNGENPFNIDYWVPPFGKYWYGFGAKYLNNPYFISIGWYLLSIFIFGLISKKVTKERGTQWTMVYLLAFNPLIVFQITQTMLDLPQMVCFLIHSLFLLKYRSNGRVRELVLAGVFLGLMAGTKPAFFVPMIGLVDLWWVYKYGGLKKIPLFVAMVIGGYLMAYTCYFVAHPNPIPFIRLHDKIIAFQKGNGGSHDVFNIFRTIFLNIYKGFWVGGSEMRIEGWSPLLPLGLLMILMNFFKKIEPEIRYLSLIGAGYILMNLTIDFWPRYLVLIVPILIIVLGKTLGGSKRHWLKWMMLLELPFLYMTLFPSSDKFSEQWQSFNSHHNYKETYQMLTSKTKSSVRMDEWLIKPLVDINNLKLVKEDNQWKYEIEK